MGLTITHRFVSAKSDSTDPTLVNPSNWNDTHVITGTANNLSSTDYDWTAQTPGGSLIVGSNSITLSPLPTGLAVGNYVYIFNGTGTAEAVPITFLGSSNIIVTCANTHTGAWQIRSATAGIQEALVALGLSGGRVILPYGTVTVYGPVRITGTGYFIQGQGMQATALVTSSTDSSNIFDFVSSGLGSFNGLSDLGIFGPGGTVPTTKAGGAALKLTNQSYFLGENIYVYAVPNVVNIKDSGCVLNNINAREVKPTAGIGIYVDGGNSFDTIINHFTLDASAAYRAGIEIVSTGYVAIDRCDIIHANYDLLIDPGNGQFVNTVDCIGSYFDTAYVAGIYIAPTGTGIVTRCRFMDCWTASSVLYGVFIQGTGSTVVDGISFIGHYSPFNTQQGWSVGGATVKNIEIRDSFAFGNSVGSSGTYDGIAIAADVIGIKVTNTVSSRYGDAANTQSRGLSIGAGASDHIQVIGNDFRENVTGPFLDSSTGVNKIIKNNLGIDNIALTTVASATSIAMPATDAPAIYISGTTTTTTITGGWRGRQVRLLKTDSSSVTIGGGGNIPGAHTLAQNQAITLTFDGSNWY